VREDPERKGLLFAGTERTVYVSFDDGDHWQSLRLNLPPTSMRDLVLHGDDLVVGTHGRSFWILDNITPLRQISEKTAQADAYLFAPPITYRVRCNNNTDTPLPPEVPAGQNPPDGAMLDYFLKSPASTPVVLEISDEQGNLVRRFSSSDQPEPVNPDELDIPTYWIRPPRAVSAEAGMHRFVWDLHYPPADALEHEYPMSAIYHDTPRYPLGPAVLPGRYTVKLLVNAKTYSQSLNIVMDPRVKTSPDGLRQQFELETKIAEAMHRDYQAVQQVRRLRNQLKALPTSGPLQFASEIAELQKKLADLEGTGGGYGAAFLGTPPGRSLARLNAGLTELLGVVDSADVAPTTQAVKMFAEVEAALDQQLIAFRQITEKDVPALNAKLKLAGVAPLKAE